MDQMEFLQLIMNARQRMNQGLGLSPASPAKAAEEGGCGVVGFAASIPVGGRHIFEPSIQMHNRGNGKGGGIAACCLDPDQLGVDGKTLREDYLLQVALLDPAAEAEIEADFVTPHFIVAQKAHAEMVDDYRDVGLDSKPPDIVRWFVRVKPDALDRFIAEAGLGAADRRAAEDEFVLQNSFRLNQRFYASLGEKRAFVLSHARNLAIFKIVGYAEQVVQYYRLDDFRAKIWIAHQRYPTKGRVWHPAGSHPFIGMNEALVHNGDFANYYSVTEYLRQHNIVPQFLTDTEVSVQLFDLWTRLYRYPLEYVIEAMAPTTELDFDRLPAEKQRIYRAIQALHMQGSPDGPWFFIIASSKPEADQYRLLGITDTAMLRPQVFAVQEGDVSIGLVASEKQAIDATLHSLAADDPRFRLVADRYWNARGGSSTDGGAFSFVVSADDDRRVEIADKFGRAITAPPGDYQIPKAPPAAAPAGAEAILKNIASDPARGAAPGHARALAAALAGWDLGGVSSVADRLAALAATDPARVEPILDVLTGLNDRRFDCGRMKRSAVLEVVRGAIDRVLDAVAPITDGQAPGLKRVTWDTRGALRAPAAAETGLVIDARGFPAEDDDRDSRLLILAFELGWRRFITYRLSGQRFHGCGFGPATSSVRLDLYGASGDYIASGIDGMEIVIHDSGQDQLGQIMKAGRLVIHGDVGQAFMYGAKGGDVFILGNGAGRPLINAVGRPRVVINGTCLDFLAESFMAGDPLNGGGFVILNGIEFDDRGKVRDLPNPYPGANLFSLASGGAIYVRDPHGKLVAAQLNGGEYADVTAADWDLIRPYLQQNEQLFGISIDDLLTVDGMKKSPGEVYRKIRAIKVAALAKDAVPDDASLKKAG